MVLPQYENTILLQSFKAPNGALVWDGFGDFYDVAGDSLVTAVSVFTGHFKTVPSPETLHRRAQLNYLISKPAGLVDLDVTVYFVDVDNNLRMPKQAAWFTHSRVPYTQMHQATGKWLPILLKQSENINAQIKVTQTADHTNGIVTEFTVR